MLEQKPFHHMTTATVSVLLQFFLPKTVPAQMDWLKSDQELLGTVSNSPQGQASSLSNSEIASGLKDALRVGTETVVEQLGQTGGFNGDPVIHTPLPDRMRQVKKALSTIGMSAMLDDLELKLNRAAEEASLPRRSSGIRLTSCPWAM